MINAISFVKQSKIFYFILSMLIIFTLHNSTALADDTAVGGGGGDTDEVTKVMCNIIGYITGTVGKPIAIIVVISVAIMLFLGKLSWGLGMAIAIGIGLLFGAPSVIKTITGDSGELCPAQNK